MKEVSGMQGFIKLPDLGQWVNIERIVRIDWNTYRTFDSERVYFDSLRLTSLYVDDHGSVSEEVWVKTENDRAALRADLVKHGFGPGPHAVVNAKDPVVAESIRAESTHA